jgi:hypothetical protein
MARSVPSSIESPCTSYTALPGLYKDRGMGYSKGFPPMADPSIGTNLTLAGSASALE